MDESNSQRSLLRELVRRVAATCCPGRVAAGRDGPPILDVDQVRKLVDRLPIPVPFEMDAMRDVIAQWRNKPIVIAPYSDDIVQQFSASGEALPAAMCISQPERDYVLHRSDTTAVHQRHSILHELGHVMLRHLREHSMHRSLYTDDYERVAETFADLVEQRIGTMRARRTSPADPTHATTIDRYGSILEG